MAPMMDVDSAHSEQDRFRLLQHGHRDMVGATAFNTYGDRFATGSVDGKIKVYNRHNEGSWNLCDTWGAHTSEILELQWLPPTIHPNLVASIGTDGRFKLWVEDPTMAPGNGRRFNSRNNRPVWELSSTARAPWLSFSIKHNPETRHTYLALVSRNGVLTVYENEEPESMDSWNELDRVVVCDKPPRGEEVAFKAEFDPNLEPCYAAIRQGVPRDALGIVVASMNKATIWRTKEISHTVSLGSSSTKEFYLAAELKGHRGLVRDVAWAPGSIRGFDVIATACKDGFVRLFQVTTPAGGDKDARSKDFANMPEQVVVTSQRTPDNTVGNAPSGIGAGLANAGPNASGNRPLELMGKDGEVIHVGTEVSKLETNRSPVWRVDFDADGQLLGSTGDDGKLALWRRAPSGIWSKSSELAMTKSISS
ncbi:WD40-repeat-containing domain protein [Amylocarpus encephaloides]|uniref:WD40-repeat-containing domain protein n=1 Tax=Amylocarpus encephaloides TaxID=45428 RepID=A0A9P7Y927_9HELO|nr:WD40-repeat-containing domain protein [Amylocarpus encephaloides]